MNNSIYGTEESIWIYFFTPKGKKDHRNVIDRFIVNRTSVFNRKKFVMLFDMGDAPTKFYSNRLREFLVMDYVSS
jgi:hypothetical protein